MLFNDIHKDEDVAMVKEIEAAADNPDFRNSPGDAEKFVTKHRKIKKKNN